MFSRVKYNVLFLKYILYSINVFLYVITLITINNYMLLSRNAPESQHFFQFLFQIHIDSQDPGELHCFFLSLPT